MEDCEAWNASRIHEEINRRYHPGHRQVPLSDVEKIVESDFMLYSWAGNGIRFRRESHQGLFLEVGKQGYYLEIQYVSREPYNRYNLVACEEFFRKASVKINDAEHWKEIDSIGSNAESCGQMHTQDLPLDDAIKQYTRFEENREALKWSQE